MEPDIARDAGTGTWRLRRWAAPMALAVLVAVSIGGVRLAVGGHVPSAPPPHTESRDPRFLVGVGRAGPPGQEGGRTPFVEVHALRADGYRRPADSVPAPRSAGEAQEVVAGPGGTFVVASFSRPCESHLHGFRLTGDGHVTGLVPLRGGTAPGLVAGTAVSPDGRRVAYATAPCGGGPRLAGAPRAAVTVLDTGTGRRRTWTAAGNTVVGHIVWAADGRTLGYTTSDVVPASPGGLPGGKVANGTVHALDTAAPGSDLGAGRVLFRAPAGAVTVTTAVMAPDGRTGYGVLRRGTPAATVLFTFAEGRGMRVTRTYPPDPNKVQLFSFVSDDEPRHACLSGPDAFGRVIEGRFDADSPATGRCTTAMGG
ncbi:hypothetical protein AGRA3207_000947 [Actinomadura graeca]|uniref:WD40-like Beta Propeller Repeat n=1 Tax=Actinomadura graeca TaxID=2750812 RepID=A0ABX8QNJ5_9ACTN|nr:hypothetical protein [Actinomadura graeca]QXJ20267.1 hypothetical protein AGRA3207_000947 [Actinomadura graeca]